MMNDPPDAVASAVVDAADADAVVAVDWYSAKKKMQRHLKHLAGYVVAATTNMTLSLLL